MSRPDWGALQQEYIAEYTRSGISPVAWCEARGLNYATARRYIKKTPKNAQTEMRKTAQKSAQKKSAQTAQKRNEKSQEKKPVFDAGLNEGDAEEFSFCPDEFGISDQQAKFAIDIVPGPSAPNTGDQNIGTVDVKITKSKMAPVKWNGEEQLALGPSGTYNTILADQFKQAFRALANEVEADLGALYFGASRAVGTAGTTPFGVKDDLSDAALARQVLEDNGAPTTDLQMVLGSTAIANLRGKQSVLFKVNESGTEQLLREGVLGRLEGFNIHSSAGVKRAPKVAATGYLVNGEKKEGDVLISIDTGSGSISAGQIVTFAGDPNQYVVAAATSNLITLAAPGLRQDLADDTAITVVGAFTANMAFDRNAFLLASRTPAMPEGGDNADDVMNVTDPISGITFQIALYRQYRQVRYEVGLAWGVSSVKPAHGCLILG